LQAVGGLGVAREEERGGDDDDDDDDDVRATDSVVVGGKEATWEAPFGSGATDFWGST
jgi:hypothetical protein